MSVLTALRIELDNRPGELAKILRPIAQANVNIHSLAGVAAAQSGTIALLPSNLIAAANAIQQAGFRTREVEVVVTWLPNRPGTLLKACEALSSAGINIEGLFVVSTDPAQGIQITVECQDAQHADQILAGVSY